ncbi:MAG: Proline-tRNA ligase [Candidatus Magasanikbacteria bacterium GW2011_GWA2_56_11]|uniref:Proline--tRNA ligase n=1 Tax=Candidatus Magasanikbacteria bacterium GW2011_GWA2_56_11 TaxID=1619044 RepID=A0A0G1YGD8_9BACT|nr:MAG: Proline-tRNA ligase [Candidatus Magasanikbacteria bacterium GW2011_GWA2_56_11]
MPKDEVSVNASLLMRAGFVDKLFAGVYTLLPLGLRVMTKIENIVRAQMNAALGQEVLMPALHPRDNWDATARWDAMDVLFKLKDSADKEYALGATHEEIITPLAQKFLISYQDLPRSIYQIQTKFRNEPRAKSGLLRGREFRMKDLYSFHADEADLDQYYETMKGVYFQVFKQVGLGGITHITFASGGAFSKYSHEFQTITSAGEDTIYVCAACQVAVNREIISELKSVCPECGGTELLEHRAIEVGNIFKLGTRFSGAFDFRYTDERGALRPVVMGCYGIGITRLLGAIVEVHHDGRGIVWPAAVAPMSVHLVSLAREAADVRQADEIYGALARAGIEVLYDDRQAVRAGEKFADSDLFGLPLRVVVSAKTLESQSVELKRRGREEAILAPIGNLLTAVTQELAG